SVEILIRQQIVHMERVMSGMEAARPDPDYLAKDSNGFDMRGVNADQIVDSSLRMLGEAQAQKDLKLDRATLAVLGEQLPTIQTARQNFHRTFRLFQIEAEEGTPRSQDIVRETLLREKDAVDIEIGKTIDILNKLTQDTATEAKKEEARATTLNWIITALAAALGFLSALFFTRSLVSPIKRLLGGTRAVEGGNLEVEIQVHSRDEIATLATSFNHMVVGLREKERIRETFGQYVDPRIVKTLLENRIGADKGERQVMTVFFSDLEGFTRMCEGLTPDAAVRFLNRYFSMMSEVVRAQQGIVDKYIGDSVMAFWGPPFTDPADHARLGCIAALDQMARLEAFRAWLPEMFGVRDNVPVVNVRMGIASGEVTVGNIGSETSRGYTVIGDTVNLASRLEQANKFYGTRILASEATRTLAGDMLAFREIDSLRVAGKLETVRVYELLGMTDELSDADRQRVLAYEAGLAHYRAQDWDAAEAAFGECLAIEPKDQPSQVMLARVEAFRLKPPGAGWDGVWVALNKCIYRWIHSMLNGGIGHHRRRVSRTTGYD
ncbi:MAG: adenylate/guanylate cyclase domain-containing protein, partial [Thiobacillus sp.]|nr:adenylate/guanylate cyclase domain-containing protein [Thiobacillus sp.]